MVTKMNLRCKILGHKYDVMTFDIEKKRFIAVRCIRCFEQPPIELMKSFLKSLEKR